MKEGDMTTQAEHEAAARQAFYTGKGLAAGDMNEQHIIDAFAAALAEAVRQEREACAKVVEDWCNESRGRYRASNPLVDAIRDRSEGAAPQATPAPEPDPALLDALRGSLNRRGTPPKTGEKERG